MVKRSSASPLFRVLPVLVLSAFLSANGRAQDGVANSSRLRWGADREGGAPYLFPDPDDSGRQIGFEVELAEKLAGKLGRPGDQFVQCQWDQILAVLSRGDIEIALNGYEFTPERASRYRSTLPYYIYSLGLCARADDDNIPDWEAFRSRHPGGRKFRVGVLEGSAADAYVSREFGDTCEPVRLSGTIEALFQVDGRQLDATVQDIPLLNYWIDHQRRYPTLAIKGENRGEGYYVIYTRPGDDALCEAINQGLRELHDSGELQAIYERYGIWNSDQEKLPAVWSGWKSGLMLSHQMTWRDLVEFLPKLFHSALITILLACLSMPLAVAIGLSVALGRSWSTPVLGGDGGGWGSRLARTVLTTYVEVVRGTPLAFQLFVVYFVLPSIGVRINEFWAGVTALAVNYSAYESEIFRLGLQAVPKGQMEAALSLGMSRSVAVRRVILPQAVRMVIPATANDFIALFKDTAVCSVIAVEELSKQYSIVAKTTGLFLETAALAAVLYLLMSYPLSLASAALERKLR